MGVLVQETEDGKSTEKIRIVQYTTVMITMLLFEWEPAGLFYIVSNLNILPCESILV